ncbi:hypothetical protein [Streptomyces chattanoogensis]|uniref:ABC transporter substrate-binding protein n=1 Tax=Streptomyces chattanoogensis TaxID=66876 RepID=A0A0N0XQJ8_9ACTN|nr:hypothetical protein [Streptomyces chattanoogensis]KPC59014.1 hypothetical protein ADL29_38340 [Streptomyces chattanoogensis]
MRRALATFVAALALAGAFSAPAHADPGPGVLGIVGDPVRLNSNIGGLQVGHVPFEVLNPLDRPAGTGASGVEKLIF